MVQTLNELVQLRNSGFGQPSPRHGLRLLYWFAHHCVIFDQWGMEIGCRPERGDFGFRRFHNRIEEEDEDRLLPRRNLPHYEVGNLNREGVNQFPRYVTENYDHNNRDSNKDRLIVCLRGSSVEGVYITEHQNEWNFDQNHTFRISQGLIQIIRNMTLEDFLRETQRLQFGLQCRYQALPRVPRDTEEGSSEGMRIFICVILLIVFVFTIMGFASKVKG